MVRDKHRHLHRNQTITIHTTIQVLSITIEPCKPTCVKSYFMPLLGINWNLSSLLPINSIISFRNLCRPTDIAWAAYSYRQSSIFVLPVCPLVMNVYSGKMADLIDMPFVVVGWVRMKNDVLDEVDNFKQPMVNFGRNGKVAAAPQCPAQCNVRMWHWPCKNGWTNRAN